MATGPDTVRATRRREHHLRGDRGDRPADRRPPPRRRRHPRRPGRDAGGEVPRGRRAVPGDPARRRGLPPAQHRLHRRGDGVLPRRRRAPRARLLTRPPGRARRSRSRGARRRDPGHLRRRHPPGGGRPPRRGPRRLGRGPGGHPVHLRHHRAVQGGRAHPRQPAVQRIRRRRAHRHHHGQRFSFARSGGRRPGDAADRAGRLLAVSRRRGPRHHQPGRHVVGGVSAGRPAAASDHRLPGRAVQRAARRPDAPRHGRQGNLRRLGKTRRPGALHRTAAAALAGAPGPAAQAAEEHPAPRIRRRLHHPGAQPGQN